MNYADNSDPRSISEWTQDFVVSDKEMSEIDNATWAYDNLIIESHVVVLAAPPGAECLGAGLVWANKAMLACPAEVRLVQQSQC